METLDLFASSSQFQQFKVYSGLDPNKTRTIHIVATGQKNQDSTNYYIDVDEFKVEQ